MKARLVIAVVVAAGGSIAPAGAQSLSSQLAGCLSVFGAVERLACYDRIAHAAASPSSGQALAPAVPAPVLPAMPASVARAPATGGPAGGQFGAEKMAAPASSPRSGALTASVSDFRNSPEGKFTIALDNGQIWKQIDGDMLARLPQSHRVKISHGFFGSYNLVFIGSNLSFKVTRIR